MFFCSFFKGKTSILEDLKLGTDSDHFCSGFFFLFISNNMCLNCVSKLSSGQVLMVRGNFPLLSVSKIKTAICRTVNMPALYVRSEFLPLGLLVKTRQILDAVWERWSLSKIGFWSFWFTCHKADCGSFCDPVCVNSVHRQGDGPCQSERGSVGDSVQL